ncbi:hypothetical protein BV898_17378 [Hypsibius exemplaris]|uniref:Uncharacterized protein n=1 Tax=Hypsibius exemplaris TaxID=2072580 RepID=A0A9X6NI06_HYPEX|nr:hypothetical protein BV898_17378 [Hypsibius exemplaris]
MCQTKATKIVEILPYLTDLHSRLLPVENDRNALLNLLEEQRKMIADQQEAISKMGQQNELLRARNPKSTQNPSSSADLGLRPERTYRAAAKANLPNRRITSGTEHVELVENERSFELVNHQRKKTPAIKGCRNVTADSKNDIFSRLCLSTQPGRDYFVRGFLLTKIDADLKECFAAMEVPLRLVAIHRSAVGDHRGTTWARIGTTNEFEEIVMCKENWPPNVSIRPWIYRQRIRLHCDVKH